MKSIKRVLPIFLAFIFSFILISPVFASNVTLHPINVYFSEPFVDTNSAYWIYKDFTFYFVVQSPSESYTGNVNQSYYNSEDSFQFFFAFEDYTYNNVEGYLVQFRIFNNTPYDYPVCTFVIDNRTGVCTSSSSKTANSFSVTSLSQRFVGQGGINLDQGYNYKGMNLGNAYDHPGTVDYSFQFQLNSVIWGNDLLIWQNLQIIQSVLNTISSSLDLQVSQDQVFYASVVDKLSRLLNEFQLLDPFDTHAKIVFIQSQLQTWLWTTYPEYFSILSGKLDHIIDLLGGNEEITTVDPSVGENVSDRVNELESLESQVNRDYSNDISFAFGSSDQVFHGNNAFSWISSQIQSIVLDNPVLSAVVIFSLAMGIAVLALGRRINV